MNFKVFFTHHGKREILLVIFLRHSTADLKHVSSGPSFSEDYYQTTFYESTHVEFAEVTSDVINAYIETGEPM